MRSFASIAVLGVLGIASPAHAGGTTNGSSGSSSSESSSSESSSSDSSSESSSDTSSSGTGTDTTGTDTSSTTDATTSDTSDTSGVVDDTTGGGCSCATGDESIAIDMPTDGAMVDAPFLVIVDVVPRCPCFDCSCAAEDFEYTQLFLDNVPWGGPCYTSPCEWEVTATLGSHDLDASATYPSGTASTSIEVFVVSVDAGTTTDPTSDPTDPTTAPPSSDTSSGFAGEAPPGGGCGCASDAGRGRTHGIASVLLVVLGARRRRRRRR